MMRWRKTHVGNWQWKKQKALEVPYALTCLPLDFFNTGEHLYHVRLLLRGVTVQVHRLEEKSESPRQVSHSLGFSSSHLLCPRFHCTNSCPTEKFTCHSLTAWRPPLNDSQQARRTVLILLNIAVLCNFFPNFR
jgi:hypothetical protein